MPVRWVVHDIHSDSLGRRSGIPRSLRLRIHFHQPYQKMYCKIRKRTSATPAQKIGRFTKGK